MSTEPDRDFTGLDVQLARLPEWQPPADFAARLAAAAARQAVEPRVPATGSWLWGRCVHHLPLALGGGLLALVLATLPWMQWIANPAFAWLIAGCAAATGLFLTLRLLRAP